MKSKIKKDTIERKNRRNEKKKAELKKKGGVASPKKQSNF